MTDLSTKETRDMMVAVPTRKPHTGGIPSGEVLHWYIAEVKYNHERLCRQQVEALGYEAYVASRHEMHYYECSHKREVEHIVIPRRVFIRIDDSQRVPLMRQCSLIYHFMTDRAKTSSPFGGRNYAQVPDQQMRDLQYMLYNASNPVSFVDQPLRLGDHIQVMRGPLKGLQGQYLRDATGTYIVITIDQLGCAMTTISTDDIRRL